MVSVATISYEFFRVGQVRTQRESMILLLKSDETLVA